jgi:hypothetical protein
MGRMTDVSKDGHWTVKDNSGKPLRWEEIERKLYGALCKLKDYEDTNLSPEQVENLKAEKEWIPVSESVPANDETVLVYVEHGKAGNIHFDGAYENGFFEPGTGWGLEDHPDVEELRITHWMPYPAPPKGV